MKIEAKVRAVEVGGQKVPLGADYQHVTVSSHWNENGSCGLVVITGPDGKESFTVALRDLEKAISAVTGLPK